MTDQRPKFGEYATPEEQRRLAGLSEVDDAPPAPVLTSQIAAQPAPRPRRVDRIVTVALLAYGLVNVVVTGLSYLDLPAVMDRSMSILGIEGTFTNFAQGRLWGTIAAIVLASGWALTAWLSIRRMRVGKLTWWVPIAGAVVTTIAASLCIMVPMLGDPAFIASVNDMVGR